MRAIPTQSHAIPTQSAPLARLPVYGSEPLAINPAAVAGALRELEAAITDTRTATRYEWSYEVHGSVAVVGIRGALWSSHYELIAYDITRAAADPDVSAIVLAIDSPGGMVHGAGETASMIRKVSAEKRVVAYVTGQGCSAAYLLAAAAGEITLAESAEVGCLGVITRWIDDREWSRKNGLSQRVMVSSQTPDKDLDPNEPDGAKRLQTRLDEHADIFLQQVANLRGVSVAEVLRDYGAGATFVGRAAVDAGLAERVTTLNELIENISGADMQKFEIGRLYQASSEFEAVPVAMTAEALAEVPGFADVLDAVRADAIAKAAPADDAEKIAAAVTDAVKAERERVAALLSIQVAGAETVVAEAIASGESADACALRILKSQADKGVTLDALRKDAPLPVVAAAAPGAGGAGWGESISRVSGSRK